ncbi:MAG: MFS transporter [Betaproteobacteria bacterium]
MKRFARKYVEFLRQPDVLPLLAVALFARMPIGMMGFAMLMYLREALGDFARAGTAVGINFVVMALAAPIQGRLIDRHGPRKLLYLTGIVQPLALVGVLASPKLGWPFATLATFAALAGAFASPITTLTRTMWRNMFEREEDRRTAFALDAVMIEVNFVLGPAIMAAILASVGTTPAFALAILAVGAAVLVFVGSRAPGQFRRIRDAERHFLGPLTEPRLLLVFASTFGEATAIGMLEVGYPAYGVALAAPAIGGLLLSINSFGSAIGGAMYGGLHFHARIERQFAATLGLMSVPLVLHAIAPTTALFACAAFFAGALIAPSIAAQSVLVSRMAPAHYATEAFTWSSSCIVAGIGIGEAVGGVLVETTGLRSAFAVAGAIVASMALLALTIPGPRRAARASAAD